MNLKKRTRFIAMAQHRAIVEGMNNEPLDRAMKYFKNRTAKEAVLKKQKIIEEKCECEICKYGFVPVLQVHHIIPVSEGGDNEQENLILLCPNCHKILHHCYRNINDEKVIRDTYSNIYDIHGAGALEKVNSILNEYEEYKLIYEFIKNSGATSAPEE